MAPIANHRSNASKMSPRRAEILARAGRLFAEKGFESASLRDIGDAVGMLRGSLYSHFDSKDQIVLELLLPPLREIYRALDDAVKTEGSGVVRLERCAEAALGCCIEYRDAFLILFQDRHLIERRPQLRVANDLANSLTPLWFQVIEAGQKDGSIRSDLDVQLLAQALFSLLFGAISDRHIGLQRATGSAEIPPDKLHQLVRAVFFEGVRTPR